MEEVTQNFTVGKKVKRQATKMAKYNPDDDDELDDEDSVEETSAPKEHKKVKRQQTRAVKMSEVDDDDGQKKKPKR